jgi:hypothetical protein
MVKRKAEVEGSAEKPPKTKKKTDDDDEEAAPSNGKTYEERLLAISPIASPMADEKLTKKVM